MRPRPTRPTLTVPAAALALLAAAAGPATAPADLPDVRAVRDQLIGYTRNFPHQDRAAVRAAFHGTTPADQAECDRDADYVWRSAQAMRAVRNHWGAAAERKFGHVIGMDTVEDDRAAAVHVAGDHATVTYGGGLRPDHLVRVDGRWLLDEPAYRADAAHDGGPPDVQYPTAAMRQVGDDLRDGRYDNVDDLIDDVEEKLGMDPAPARPTTAAH